MNVFFFLGHRPSRQQDCFLLHGKSQLEKSENHVINYIDTDNDDSSHCDDKNKQDKRFLCTSTYSGHVLSHIMLTRLIEIYAFCKSDAEKNNKRSKNNLADRQAFEDQTR